MVGDITAHSVSLTLAQLLTGSHILLWGLRRGCQVLEVDDVEADVIHLALDGCNNFTTQELGACKSEFPCTMCVPGTIALHVPGVHLGS